MSEDGHKINGMGGSKLDAFLNEDKVGLYGDGGYGEKQGLYERGKIFAHMVWE